MRIELITECKQGMQPYRQIETLEVYDLIDAFKLCYDRLNKTWDEKRIRAWDYGYSVTDGYFGNQYLSTFKVLKD